MGHGEATGDVVLRVEGSVGRRGVSATARGVRFLLSPLFKISCLLLFPPVVLPPLSRFEEFPAN